VKTSDFSFNLPEELIAQYPPEKRGESRLMLLNREDGAISDLTMDDFPSLVPQGALVVFNNTRVRKSRLFGTTAGGGSVEFLLLRETAAGEWETVLQRRKRQHIGRRYTFPEGVEAELIAKPEGCGIIRFDPAIDNEYLERNAAIPLPPYIKRPDEEEDAERYQTIYSRETGSVAAPTAGLHFTEQIMQHIRQRAAVHYVTLHVGIGTFAPIRSEILSDHRMHREEYEVPAETADGINQARAEGRTVIAVGTTSVRTLESAWSEGRVHAGRASTELFIQPGYRFNVVDRLFTNFHTPESSLLVMVSAFAGRETILRSYARAVELGYRFFSYGDAMYIQ